MINYIWFTRTENFYAELDALFYFFLTVRTSQEHESSCEAMPGGLTFPGFSFTQQKFHSPSKPMGFFALFHFMGFWEIILQSLFLGRGGCFCFLAEKKERLLSLIPRFSPCEVVSCRSKTQAQTVNPLLGQRLLWGWRTWPQPLPVQSPACLGGPVHPFSSSWGSPGGRCSGALPPSQASPHPKSRPGGGPGCPPNGARQGCDPLHTLRDRALLPAEGAQEMFFNSSPCHDSWCLWMIWPLTGRSWCKSKVREKEIPAASLETPCQAWGWQSCSPWTVSARFRTSGEGNWRDSGPSFSPGLALSLRRLSLCYCSHCWRRPTAAPRDAAGRSAPSPRSSGRFSSEPTHDLQGSCA